MSHERGRAKDLPREINRRFNAKHYLPSEIRQSRNAPGIISRVFHGVNGTTNYPLNIDLSSKRKNHFLLKHFHRYPIREQHCFEPMLHIFS